MYLLVVMTVCPRMAHVFLTWTVVSGSLCSGGLLDSKVGPPHSMPSHTGRVSPSLKARVTEGQGIRKAPKSGFTECVVKEFIENSSLLLCSL